MSSDSDFSDRKRPKTLCLFDVDGTLTAARQVITPEMRDFIFNDLKAQCVIGVVGGSNYPKIKEQMGGVAPESVFDFSFAENGLTAHRGTTQLESASFVGFLGEERLKEFVNFCLHYIADLDIPVKRGTFIEFRAGMLNVSPIGRNCSQEERIAFNEFDKEAQVRPKFVKALQEKFAGWGLKFSIGGQISFDVFPEGWDKTYCLRHVKKYAEFDEIHFFGDKTFEGGNDYEIYTSDETIGHAVTSPEDTMAQLKSLFAM